MAQFNQMNPFKRICTRSRALALIPLSFLLLVSFPLTTALAGERTPESVLIKLSKTFEKQKGFESQFSQKLKVPNGDPIASEGNLIYKSPGKMILRYLNPAGQVLLLEGNSLAFYVPQSHQVLMKTMHSRNIPETPALLFANLGHLRKFFYIRPEQGGSVPRQGIYALELIPRKPDRHLATARITVDMGTGLPRSITFTEFNGTEIAINLLTLHPLSKVSDRSFQLRLPPGTTVFHTKGGF
ncbi:MAG: LolA family protein [Leptospirales bacterium]